LKIFSSSDLFSGSATLNFPDAVPFVGETHALDQGAEPGLAPFHLPLLVFPIGPVPVLPLDAPR
jgi:hypothetical protein